MREALQFDLLDPRPAQEFEQWRQTAGGRRILQMAYAIAARFARRYQRTGRRVSIRLIWETLRDNVGHIRRHMKAKGQDVALWDGFRLNDHFHAYVARHILEHRPEWAGLFEMRECGKCRTKKKVVVIYEKAQTETRAGESEFGAPAVSGVYPKAAPAG